MSDNKDQLRTDFPLFMKKGTQGRVEVEAVEGTKTKDKDENVLFRLL